MNNIVFKGCGTALITPFRNGEIDFEALEKLIENQIAGGVSAIIVLGTTGEPATMTKDEKAEIITFARKQIAGRVKLIVGTGGNNTAEVIEASLSAKAAGADALLVITPYYNKCTQNGLVEHYRAVLGAVKMPCVLYNVPGRTGLNMLPETVLKIFNSDVGEYLAGVKEANCDASQIMTLCKNLRNKTAIYSGDDMTALALMHLGAVGVISVSSNVIPAEVSKLTRLFFDKKYAEALELHEKLYDLNNAIFIEVSPIPIKALAAELGLCKNELRLPLTPIEEANKTKLMKVYNAFKKA